MRHPSDRWKIESGTNFITGKPEWRTTPPRFVYGPRAEGKRSHATYDEALAHVQSANGRKPRVFPSKTHVGEWFWLSPDGKSGWEKDHAAANAKAYANELEAEVA